MNIETDQSALLVIDVQEKLAGLMHDHDHLLNNIKRAILISQALDIPIIWSEQAPDKIGSTVDPVASLLFPLIKPLSKRTFSCYQTQAMRSALDNSGRRQIVLVGIETHVCVYQTACDLNRHGYDVYVPIEAVSSRSIVNKEAALFKMRQEGINLAGIEAVACAWIKGADHPVFRDVMSAIKQ